MIDNCLVTVVAELNEHLNNLYGLSSDSVVISDIDPDEIVEEDADGRVLATLINIEEDKLATQKHSPTQKLVYLNLYILFSTSFARTKNTDALKFISGVLSFFGNKPVFNSENTPGLNPGIEKMSFDVYNLTFHEQSDMWNSLGANSRPAVLYKVYGVHVGAPA
ncbi:hypothetical protein BH11BAC7_BH11BAC7_27640 [soil metagenome]